MSLRKIGLWLDAKSAAWWPMTWALHVVVALPFIALVAWRREFGPAAVLGFIEGERMWFWFLYKLDCAWQDVGLNVLPIGLFVLVAFVPWTGPGVMYLLRELRQMRQRQIDGKSMIWLDHIMDVMTPGFVGWLFLR